MNASRIHISLQKTINYGTFQPNIHQTTVKKSRNLGLDKMFTSLTKKIVLYIFT